MICEIITDIIIKYIDLKPEGLGKKKLPEDKQAVGGDQRVFVRNVGFFATKTNNHLHSPATTVV